MISRLSNWMNRAPVKLTQREGIRKSHDPELWLLSASISWSEDTA
jgi:hypothetical protein